MSKNTDELKKEITKIEDFDRFLKENRDCFTSKSTADIFYLYLEKSGLSKADLAKKSGMSEVYLYQILSGKRMPSRNRVISLCYGLSLPFEETDNVLQLCGYATLYAKNRRDAVILYGLEKKWDIYKLNDKLYELGEETLF